MESYEDRPISVYDNLNNTPLNATPKAQTSTLSSPLADMPTTTESYGNNAAAAHTPFPDISFNFIERNGNESAQQHPNHSLNQSQARIPPTAAQVHSYYATPYRSRSSATWPLKAPTTTAPASTNETSTANAAHRPFSQQSKAKLNEATQNIAAVKAALNDAKSKFFGLNNITNNINESQTEKLLETNNIEQPHLVQIQTSSSTKPLLPPKPKVQPKYQNIPANSAIFLRSQQPAAAAAAPTTTTTTLTTKPDLLSKPEIAPKPDIVFPNDNSPEKIDPNECRPFNLNASPALNEHVPFSPAEMEAMQPTAKISSFTTQIPLSEMDSSQPSQAVYMATTVPQNIKGSKIAGRHTPTRNSLRHSRMLVVNNKNYQDMETPNPLNFACPSFARWLLIFEIMIGVMLSLLAVWIFFLAPNTATRDNPYWSGLALLCAGILGLVLIRYQRIKRHKVRENCFIFLRANSYILSLVATLLCCLALVCAALHLARLSANSTKCVSTNILLEHGSCSCTFNANANNGTKANIDDSENGGEHGRSYTVEYRDLSCNEVQGEWMYILGISTILNALGFSLSMLYMVMLAFCRDDNKRLYSSVQTTTF